MALEGASQFRTSKEPTRFLGVGSIRANEGSWDSVREIVRQELGIDLRGSLVGITRKNIVFAARDVEEAGRIRAALGTVAWRGGHRLRVGYQRPRLAGTMPADIADPPQWMPPGFSVVPDFLGEGEEAELMASLAAGEWEVTPGGRRRIQHFGWHVNYATTEVAPLPARPLPEAMLAVADRVHAHRPQASRLDQATVNEYRPGQGIKEHVDAHEAFEEMIAIVSLGSPAALVLRDRDGAGRVLRSAEVAVPRRSLVVLEGEARYLFTHEVPARLSDVVNGVQTPRALRYSMTFRRVRRRPCECPFVAQCDTQNARARARQKEKDWAARLAAGERPAAFRAGAPGEAEEPPEQHS